MNQKKGHIRNHAVIRISYAVWKLFYDIHQYLYANQGLKNNQDNCQHMC